MEDKIPASYTETVIEEIFSAFLGNWGRDFSKVTLHILQIRLDLRQSKVQVDFSIYIWYPEASVILPEEMVSVPSGLSKDDLRVAVQQEINKDS